MIAVFYHSWYAPNAFPIIKEAMDTLRDSGLLDFCDSLTVGLNGHPNGEIEFPKKSNIIVHPPESKSENLTLVSVHEFAKNNPGAYVLYFHSKGATHEPDHWCFPLMTRWRECMTNHCVKNWKECIEVLACYEMVGAHWMDKNAHAIPFSIFGGNFWWARTDFLNTLPSMYERHKTRTGHLGDWDNRYEAEVWIGTGPRDPIVFSYHPGHPGCHG